MTKSATMIASKKLCRFVVGIECKLTMRNVFETLKQNTASDFL